MLRRSQDPTPDDPAAGVRVFRRTATGWDLAFGDRRTFVADAAGLGHIAAVLAANGRPVHVLDIVEAGVDGSRLVAELRTRLDALDEHLAAADDPVAAALGRAERDLLCAELAGLARLRSDLDPDDPARRLVALRIRTALDRLDDALPALGRHLRRSVRTGTFCVYEPERPERWTIGG